MTRQEALDARTASLVVHLPLPPSTNHLFATVPNRGGRGTRRIITREYQAWRDEAAIVGRPWPRYSNNRRNRILWNAEILARGLSNQRDLDNVIKPVLDLITTHTGLRDNYCFRLVVDRTVAIPRDGVQVTVTVIGEDLEAA